LDATVIIYIALLATANGVLPRSQNNPTSPTPRGTRIIWGIIGITSVILYLLVTEKITFPSASFFSHMLGNPFILVFLWIAVTWEQGRKLFRRA
jgi:hypothetical protein